MSRALSIRPSVKCPQAGRSPRPALRGLGTATPSIRVSQAEACRRLAILWGLAGEDLARWERMEEKILAAEGALAAAEKAMEDPAVASDFTQLQARSAELEKARQEVERLYSRWAELEEKRG